MVKYKQECRNLIHRNNPMLNGHSSTNLCTMNSKFSAILLLFRECLELQQINLFDFSITRVSSCYFIKEINRLLCSPQETVIYIYIYIYISKYSPASHNIVDWGFVCLFRFLAKLEVIRWQIPGMYKNEECEYNLILFIQNDGNFIPVLGIFHHIQ